MNDIETIILEYLIFNNEFFEKVIPYLDYKLFEQTQHKCICKFIQTYYQSEQEQIPYDILGIKIQNIQNVNTETIEKIKNLYNKLSKPENNNIDGIIKETEKYFKQRKIWNVIANGIEQFEKQKSFNSEFLEQAENAITYSFEDKVGYDYIDNVDERFKTYKENVIKIPTSIKTLNDFTNGGIEKKTLNACISATNGGKSVWLCQEAAFNLLAGRNVLYITLEMSEIQISKRIDANILNIEQDKLKTLSDEAIKFRFKDALKRTQGRLFIQEFPADSCTVLDIKNILDKIKRKHKIDIDVLIVDYLGIMSSYRYSTKNNNSYTIGKHTTEELRSLAVQYNIPIWTAIQFNRGAENTNDIKSLGMGQTSDSYGIPMGLDLLFAIIHTDELDAQNKAVFKILKTRYGANKNTSGLFTVKQNWGLARFENDAEQIDFKEKNDNNTKAGRMINEQLRQEKTNTTNNINTNTLMDNNEGLFDGELI